MTSIISNVNQIQISPGNIATFNIKMAKISNQSPTYPLLFKVKTNVKDYVDVRPSVGVLRLNQNKLTELQVKYTGKPEDIAGVKIMVRWISNRENGPAIPQKINHSQFKQLYDKCKDNSSGEKEGILILPCVAQADAQRQRDKEIRFSQSSQNSVKLQEKSGVVEDTMEDQKGSQVFESAASVRHEAERQIKVQNKIQTVIPQVKGIALPLVLVIALIALLIGVSLGIKIERMIGNGPSAQEVGFGHSNQQSNSPSQETVGVIQGEQVIEM